MKRIFGIFRIHREERWPALFALCLFTLLNALQLVAYYDRLTQIFPPFTHQFIKRYHLSGFDPITYAVMTDWHCGYNIYRHPLLAYFVWPFTKLNEALISLTGINCAIIIVAVILIACAFYSFIFLSRIFYEVIGTRRREAYVLTIMAFSFAYIMLANIAPDHFGPSMFIIILTLYLCGIKLQRGRALNWWQTIVMFFFTAGISLNNGLKTFLMALMTRRRRFFKPGYLIIAVLLPSALMWGAARLGYKTFVWPKEMARKERTKERFETRLENYRRAVADTIKNKDSASIQKEVDKERQRLLQKKAKRWRASATYKHSGKPMGDGEFSRWTDKTTSRWDVAVECLFGEGIMLHEDYLLGDVLVNRPVIVRYHNWFNYIVEGTLLTLFLIGVWFGRRNHFLWTALSFFLLDMLLHMGLGFGINEISIMSAHYLFVLPIGMAFILPRLAPVVRRNMLYFLAGITAYLWIWNVLLLTEYLYF
jgi:hypothetical protein